MKEFYEWLIIGATFTGLGAAYARKKNALIIERTSQVGYEYVNSFNPGTNWNFTELSADSVSKSATGFSQESNRLKNELIERKILSEGGQVYIPALAPVLYNRIRQDNISVLLMTDIVNISRGEQGFEVEVYNTSGFGRFKVLNILDTTYNCISHRSLKPQILSKSINTIIHNSQSAAISQNPLEWQQKLEFIETKYEDEKILKLKLCPKDNWVSARNKLHHLWSTRPDSMKSWTIAAVADNFDVKVEKGLKNIEDNWDLLPSCAYNNPLESFEAGIQYILGKEGEV